MGWDRCDDRWIRSLAGGGAGGGGAEVVYSLCGWLTQWLLVFCDRFLVRRLNT